MKLISRITAEKLKEGDELAFEEIFYAYRNIVYFECLKKMRNPQDANDCVQEIFIKLVEKLIFLIQILRNSMLGSELFI